ncbi:MAG: MBL fold metallo-hydrolase [Sphingomonas bacterium]|nr:MBL fold metallo-hydrolase [Sphingomonas bacterium]
MSQSTWNRREAMMLGAGALSVAAAPPSLRSSQPLTVPEVDRLTIQTIVDAATFGPFLPPIERPGLRVTRAGNGGPPRASRMLPNALLGEFGLSLLARSTRGTTERHILLDLGYSREVLANNIALLGIDRDRIDAAVLSHGHLDHYGGYAGLFGAQGARHRLPLTVGGEETFCERVAQIGDPPPVMGALDRAALAQAGFAVQIDPAPQIVAGHGFTTGIIPLQSSERAAIPTEMRPGVGCDRRLLDPAKRKLTQVADDGQHELALAYAVRGLGLVVLASCSHRGVINSVRRAQQVSGIERVHAVIGGFHLVRPRTDEEARWTVAEFARIAPSFIIPMHCTGESFIAEASRLMPDKVIRSYVGSTFDFAA